MIAMTQDYIPDRSMLVQPGGEFFILPLILSGQATINLPIPNVIAAL
jgi:hypothetical protein